MTAWTKASLTEKGRYLRLITAADPLYRFSPEKTAIDMLALPFYPAAFLLRVLRLDRREPCFWYVALQGDLVPLDGSAANLNWLDAAAPLALAPDNAALYERFRAAFGNGRVPDAFSFSAQQVPTPDSCA